MMMAMNCYCGMVDRRKVLNLISSRDHSQKLSPWQTSQTPRAGFEPAQNPSSGFVQALVIEETLYLKLARLELAYLTSFTFHADV